MSEFKLSNELKITIPSRLVVIFVLFSIIIIMMGIYYYKVQRNKDFKEQEKNLSAIASLKIQEIVNWHRERIGDASAIKDNQPLIKEINQFFRDSKEPEIRRDLTKWVESVYKSHDYSSVLLVDTLLKVRLSVTPFDTVAGDAITDELHDALGKNMIVMTDLHRSRCVSYVHLDLIIPLTITGQIENKPFGFIILRVDPEKILFPLVKTWPTPSKSSETLILRRQGDSIIYLNDLRHQHNTALNLKMSLSNTNLLAAKAVNGYEGFYEGIDYRNKPVVGYLSRIPGLPWFMVAKVDKEEIEEPLRKQIYIALLGTILLILINASIFGFWIWDQQVRLYHTQLNIEAKVRESEEKFLNSEERFRSLYENVNIGIYRTTLDGHILMANPAMVHMLGYESFKELTQTNMERENNERGFHGPDFLKTIEQKGTINGLQSTWRNRDGKAFFVRESATAVRDSYGQILFFDGTVEDITERKKAEKELHLLASRHEAILYAVPDIIMEVDNDKKYTWANNSGYEFFGDEVLGKEASYYFEGEQYTYKKVLPLFSGSNDIIYLESWQRRKDGKNRLLAWWCRTLKDESGNVTGALSTARDITESNRLTEQIEEERNKLSSLLNSIPDEVWFADSDKKFTLANPNALLEFGLTGTDNLDVEKFAQSLEVFLADGSPRPVGMAPPLRALEGEIVKNFEEIVLLPNKKEQRHRQVNAAPVRDASGKIIGSISVVRDITELKESERKIKQLNEELEQRVIDRTGQLEAANKELEAFSYSVSHDLRAPLRAVHSYTNILMEEYENRLDAEGKRLCGIISSSATQMGGLIDDLLSFSRIGRSTLSSALLEMKSVVKSAFDEVYIDSKKNKTKFAIRKLHKVKGDPVLIRLVWNNLISNAIKYSSKTNNPEITIGSVQGKGSVTYFVRDNGVGFDMQYKHKLFGVFQRLHSESEFEGNGVGLAIVQRIILKHNGTVWAEGEVGKGATFFFSLPENGEEKG
jgi:PAS domain S-box-containing protein